VHTHGEFTQESSCSFLHMCTTIIMRLLNGVEGWARLLSALGAWEHLRACLAGLQSSTSKHANVFKEISNRSAKGTADY
jgi:hypothetical protein